jgi:hypothetical protein
MRRKWIAGVAALAAIGGTTMAAASVIDNGAEPLGRPGHSTVTVDLSRERPAPASRAKPGSKSKVVYLKSTTSDPISTADVSAGGLGPYISIKLKGCKKVIDGGVVPSDPDIYLQGSWVKSPRVYEVLVGLDDNALAERPTFTFGSFLTCLKGGR